MQLAAVSHNDVQMETVRAAFRVSVSSTTGVRYTDVIQPSRFVIPIFVASEMTIISYMMM